MDGLYEQDYFRPTEQEFKERDIAIKNNTPYPSIPRIRNSKYYYEQPKAIRHYESLFPNNFLDNADLRNCELLSVQNENFIELLNNTSITELDIKRFIDESKAYHIIGSIFQNYRFGHHGAYLFEEFSLGTSYRADYLLVGNASGGHQFVFIECENPYHNVTVSDGNFGETIRKGINQINDWSAFIQSDYSSITTEFKKYTRKQLPDEFYKYDATRFNYVVIAGRRSDFSEKTYRLARESKTGLEILHYDNVVDLAQEVIGKSTY